MKINTILIQSKCRPSIRKSDLIFSGWFNKLLQKLIVTTRPLILDHPHCKLLTNQSNGNPHQMICCSGGAAKRFRQFLNKPVAVFC